MGLHPMAEVRLKFCNDDNSTKVYHFAMMDTTLLICQSSSLACLLASSVKETIPTVVLVSPDSSADDSSTLAHQHFLATISSSNSSNRILQLLHLPRQYSNSNQTLFPSLRNRQGTWKYDPTYHEKRGYWDPSGFVPPSNMQILKSTTSMCGKTITPLYNKYPKRVFAQSCKSWAFDVSLHWEIRCSIWP